MLPDYSGLVKAMKEAGANATEAKAPVKVCFGKVTSASPLKISVEQKITLGSAQLVLTRNVTDYNIDVTVDWTTDETSEHSHTVTNKKTMTVHNALQKGDEVILLRVQGGQKYVVMDRVR